MLILWGLLLLSLIGLQDSYAESGLVGEGFGPVRLRNQYPLARAHYTWAPTSAEVLPVGASSLRGSVAWSNTSALRGQDYLIDAETRELRATFVSSPIPNFQYSLEIPIYWRGGGVLDPFIDSFHSLFGLPRGDRDLIEDDQYEIAGVTKDGDGFAFDDSGTQFGNTLVGVRYALLNTSARKVSLESEISLPTSHSSFGHQGLDFMVGLIGSQQWGRVIGHFGVAQVAYSDREVEGVRYKQFHSEAFGSIEYILSEGSSLSASFSWSSETVENIPSHASYWGYLDIGYKHALSKEYVFELLFREDAIARHATTDFDLLFAVARTLY